MANKYLQHRTDKRIHILDGTGVWSLCSLTTVHNQKYEPVDGETLRYPHSPRGVGAFACKYCLDRSGGLCPICGGTGTVSAGTGRVLCPECSGGRGPGFRDLADQVLRSVAGEPDNYAENPDELVSRGGTEYASIKPEKLI